MLELASNFFDLIIIDTPPVGVFPDALFAADFAHESIFITKHRSVPRQKVKFGLTQLRRGAGEVIGVIVNQMNEKKSLGGYGYSDYGYGYGYNAKKYEEYYSDESR